MPRVSRRPKKRREQYGEDVVDHLYHGHCMTCMVDHSRHTDAEMKVAWEELKHSVLPEFVRQNPGSRPWAWWTFDAPAPGRRERSDGGVHPFDNPARTLHVANSDGEGIKAAAFKLYFGLPGAMIPQFDGSIKYESYEPEWSLLVRHNLLLPEDSP